MIKTKTLILIRILPAILFLFWCQCARSDNGSEPNDFVLSAQDRIETQLGSDKNSAANMGSSIAASGVPSAGWVKGSSLENTRSSGVTYYVATTGSDNNPGTETRPWRTIQKSFDAATPGSTVFIKNGTYRESVEMHVSGSAEQGFIRFMPFGADRVTIDGTGINVTNLVEISDRAYVVLKGIHVANFTRDRGIAIHIAGASDHIEIRNCMVTNIKMQSGTTWHVIDNNIPVWNEPIQAEGTNGNTAMTNIIIDGNTVRDAEEGWAETITVTGNADTFEVTNNWLEGCQKMLSAGGRWISSPNPANDFARNGIFRGNYVNCGSRGVGFYNSGAEDFVVEGNTFTGNDWGIVITEEHAGVSLKGITVRSNLVYGNKTGGIAIGGWGGDGTITDSQILNNTVVESGIPIMINQASRIEVRNNIFSNPTGHLMTTISTNAGHVLDYNQWDPGAGPFGITWGNAAYTTLAEYRSATGLDLNSKQGNPLYVLTGGSYRLNPSSPAVDAGDPAFAAAERELDFDGEQRIQGGRVDMGAYEQARPSPGITIH